ncbi:L,D-transpeptidase family protein [Streptosporangium sp. KLBMP 9127]|nr:L,D-transpeptidase family protein [Streptosporangium sp. KLBMP 9127]
MINQLIAPALVLALSGAIPVVLAVQAAPAHAGTHVLRPGDRGPEVKRLQRQLRWLGYEPGKPTGRFDPETRVALWAFQKSQGLRVRDDVRPVVWEALDRPRPLRALVPRGRATRVEIDLDKQLLALYKGDTQPLLVTHVSTGAGIAYCTQGRCGTAVTPAGDFRVTSRAPGWTTGPLGSMFNSMYFNGGIAMHGSTKVPLTPASHGCVRLPMHVAERLYRLVSVGDPVHVRAAGMVGGRAEDIRNRGRADRGSRS